MKTCVMVLGLFFLRMYFSLLRDEHHVFMETCSQIVNRIHLNESKHVMPHIVQIQFQVFLSACSIALYALYSTELLLNIQWFAQLQRCNVNVSDDRLMYSMFSVI